MGIKLGESYLRLNQIAIKQLESRLSLKAREAARQMFDGPDKTKQRLATETRTGKE